MQSYFFAELTSEESLAMKANYAREMAKAVNSAQFKKKRLFAKKQDAKIDDKEKVSRVPCKTTRATFPHQVIFDYSAA